MDKQTAKQLATDLCEILEDFAQNGIKTAADVETVKHALSGLSKIKIMESMDAYNGEYSHGSSSRDVSYRREGSYSRPKSDYNSHEDMRRKLENIMKETESEQERMALQEALQKL